MVRVRLLLVPLLLLLSVADRSWGQSAAAASPWSPRRDAVRVSAARPVESRPSVPPPVTPAARDSSAAGGETLRWRRYDEQVEQLAQRPQAPPQMPAMPSDQAPILPPPSNGFSEATSPSWTSPGYWQPNPMMGMPGEPDCPPGTYPPNGYGYGYGEPCPPPLMPPLT